MTPSKLPNRESGPQNQPRAKVAVSVLAGKRASMGGILVSGLEFDCKFSMLFSFSGFAVGSGPAVPKLQALIQRPMDRIDTHSRIMKLRRERCGCSSILRLLFELIKFILLRYAGFCKSQNFSVPSQLSNPVIQKAQVGQLSPRRARRTRRGNGHMFCLSFVLFVFFVVK